MDGKEVMRSEKCMKIGAATHRTHIQHSTALKQRKTKSRSRRCKENVQRNETSLVAAGTQLPKNKREKRYHTLVMTKRIKKENSIQKQGKSKSFKVYDILNVFVCRILYQIVSPAIKCVRIALWCQLEETSSRPTEECCIAQNWNSRCICLYQTPQC